VVEDCGGGVVGCELKYRAGTHTQPTRRLTLPEMGAATPECPLDSTAMPSDSFTP
jgi:hypothetical protein